MHILHVISSLDPRLGGPPAALRGLTLAQRQLGQDITVVTTRRSDHDASIEEELRNTGISVYSLGPTRTPLGLHPSIRPTLKKTIANADVIHIHGLWEDIQHHAATESKRIQKPYIFSPHGMLDPWSLKQSAWKKKFYMGWRLKNDLNSASKIHCCSQIECDLIKPLGLKPPSFVEPNGIDFNEFNPLPEPNLFRARHAQIADQRIVLFLSRIHHKKGLDLLIPAFSQAGLQDTLLILAGPCDKTYREKLDRMIEDNNLSNRVIFTGMLNGRERIEALCDADLFVLPSYQENFGIVVIESLAAGTPVLISDQVNIWNAIRDANVGYICETTVESLAKNLNHALNNPTNKNAENCINFAKQNFNWPEIAKHWKQHFKEIL